MSANRIHALPLHLANQIAAGEVIERPASVVKELIENSIDANATQITVNIEGAGSQLIRVQDNGIGIHPDDLAIALSRHATSKINSSEQLSHISSLGFRGEALPSIASISRLTLLSRQADSECGYKLSANETEKSPVSAPYGTQIEVRDLFFNLPARRRFLRSNNTEQHHILTTIQRLALSQFHIGFHYKNAANTKLKLPIADTDEQKRQRIAKICGNAFLKNSLYLKQNYDDIELSGWLVKADAHRAQTDIQYFFINGRVIRDRVINHAIRQAYGALIPTGRQPAYVLYLTIPLESVDINVHPTKHEVRFRNARLVHGLIISAIQEALASNQAMIKPDSIPDNVSEKSIEPYFSSNLITDESVKKTDLDSSIILGKPITLLEQRYSINQTNQGFFLIDLQKAKQELIRDQLHDAIKNDSLRSRPILVPIVISTDEEQIKAASDQRELLEKLAIHCQRQDQKLIITAIPSLLSQVNLKSLMSDILSLLTKEQTQEQQLIYCLQEHIPLTAIQDIEQARQLLQQLQDSSSKKEWCIALDKLTLSSLF